MPFSQIAERVSTYGRSGALPGVEFEDIISGEGCLNKNLSQKQCTKDGKLFQEGDVLFGKLRPYLRNIILANFKGVAIGDFWVLRGNESTHSFLYYLINSEAFIAVANVTSGSKMPRADWGYVSSAAFSLPSLPEQTTIANFFTHLDTLIASTSRRLEKLRAVKAAALQTLFPQEGEKEPRVRFKGFSGGWESVKLNSIAQRVVRKNKNLESDLALTISSQYGLISQREFFNSLVVGANIADYYLIKKGEFAYNKSSSGEYSVGSVKRLDRYDKGILSTLYILFSLKGGVSSDFIAHYFATKIWFKEVFLRAEEGARNHGLLNIGAADFLDINVSLPSLPEQTAIANFFTHLDALIASTTRRLDKLRAVKAACLEGMFV